MCQSTPSTMTSPLEWTRCNASLPLHRPGYHPVRSTPGPCPHVSVWDYRSSRPSVCLQSLCIVNQSNHQQQNEDGAKREGVHAEHIARKFSHFFDRIDSREHSRFQFSFCTPDFCFVSHIAVLLARVPSSVLSPLSLQVMFVLTSTHGLSLPDSQYHKYQWVCTV